MIIDDDARVESILERENYYNVINGYKDLFLSRVATAVQDEEYMKGTTFDEVYALYTFDRNIRNIYLKYSLQVENTFKSVVAHEFSKNHGHRDYLKLNSFQSSTPAQVESVTRLIGDIQQEIARQLSKHHQVVTHYMVEHGYIPLWVLVNVLTFGKITMFYANMNTADKVAVARAFHLQPEELHKYMGNLTQARNKCAHDERFYNMRFRRNLKSNSIPNFSVLNIPRDRGNNIQYGTSDIFSIAIIFSRVLPKDDLNDFITAMEKEFEILKNSLNTIKAEDIMVKMGFGSDWKELAHIWAPKKVG